jgi:hypothetical protein
VNPYQPHRNWGESRIHTNPIGKVEELLPAAGAASVPPDKQATSVPPDKQATA